MIINILTTIVVIVIIIALGIIITIATINIKELAWKKIITYLDVMSYRKIDVKTGQCRYNFRCHNNTVHDAIENKEDKIAIVVYIDDNQPIVHFVNVNSNGEFIDNTLGHWSTQYDYYLLSYVERNQFFRVYNYHNMWRERLRSSLPLYMRVVLPKRLV